MKRLSLLPITDLHSEKGPVVHVGGDKASVTAAAKAHGTDWVVVVDGSGRLRGWFAAGESGGAVSDNGSRPFSAEVSSDDSIHTVLSAMITSRNGVVAHVGADGRYEGVFFREQLYRQLDGRQLW